MTRHFVGAALAIILVLGLGPATVAPPSKVAAQAPVAPPSSLLAQQSSTLAQPASTPSQQSNALTQPSPKVNPVAPIALTQPSPKANPVAPIAATVARSTSSAVIGRFTYRAIGLYQTVYKFRCSWHVVPRGFYQWACAYDMGPSNRIFIGHAYDSMYPLVTVYAHHRLKVGQIAYLTVSGKTVRYKLAWVRLVPASGVWHGFDPEVWAWPATTDASITLWTCYGSKSQYRLVVRLVQG